MVIRTAADIRLMIVVRQTVQRPDSSLFAGFTMHKLSKMVLFLACPLYLLQVAAAQFLNRLPNSVMSANSLSSFRQQLKHMMFQQSFPDIIM